MFEVANRYRRLTEPVVRGPIGIAVTVAVFLAASRVGSRDGLAIASAWILVSGLYCLANFWCCRETHCVVTGGGWTALALLGLAAGVIPGDALSFVHIGVVVAVYLVILAAGYGFQAVMAARTGSHSLGVGRDGTQAR
ncbi:MAG: hypothetical protein ACRDYY_16665 [Acidimicrobiales bacterium]